MRIDADVALQTRLSFGRRAWYVWLLVAGFVAYTARTLTLVPQAVGEPLITCGTFLLILAVPYAAIQIVTLEEFGQLDQRRLTGRGPAALLIALIAGSCWPVLLLGAAAVTTGCLTIGRFPAPTFWMKVAVGFAGGFALLGIPRAARIDRTILTALMLTMSALLTVLSQWARPAYVGAAAATGVLALTAPAAVARMRRARDRRTPAVSSDRRRPARIRRMVHTRVPEIARTMLASADSTRLGVALLLMVGGAMVVAARRGAPPSAYLGLTLLPLLLAGYECSARMHAETRSGGLDRLRLTGQPPWPLMLQLTYGCAFPFIAVSVAALFAAAVILGFQPDIARDWVLLGSLLVLSGMSEGLRQSPPGAYIVPAVVFSFVCVARPSVEMRFVAGALAGLAALASVRNIAAGANARLEGAAAGATAVVIGAAAAIVGRTDVVSAAAIASLASGPILSTGASKGTPASPAMHGLLAGSAALAVDLAFSRETLVLTLQTLSTRTGIVTMPVVTSRLGLALLVGVAAGAGLIFGRLVQTRYGSRPWRALALRAVPLLMTLLMDMPIWFLWYKLRMRVAVEAHLDLNALYRIAVILVLVAANVVLALKVRRAETRRGLPSNRARTS
jgi:hypothetical protein